MDGHDLDRRFALVDAERACGPLLFPPVEEERNVGHAPRREADDLFVNGLQIGRFAAPAVEPVAHDQFLESLFGRQQADRAQEIGLLRRQLRVELPSQVAVVDGFANRILLFDRQAECRRDEAAHGSTADDERLLRHDVEPVARIVVAPFEIEQLFGHACAVVASPHENDDLLGTEPPVDRLLDPFDQRRIPGEGLDADVPFVAALFAGALCVRRVGFGERTSQLRGERLGDGAFRDTFVERTAQGRAVDLHDSVD